MRVKTILQKLVRVLKPVNEKFTEANLCGIPLHVLPGTIRGKEDQDDTWWFYLTKHHEVIYDLGCNIGYTALLALIQYPNKQMILVDPNPKALQNAARNIIENNLGNRVQYMSAFVSNTLDETVKFYTVGSGEAGSMHASHAVTAASMNSFMEVKTVTLDHLLDVYGLTPDLVKIDVEGAETLVMQGAKKLTTKSQCTFFVEMHNEEDLNMEAGTQLMLDWCEEMNYSAWYLKTGEKIQSAEVTKDRGKCHLLLLPKNQPYPEYLIGIEQHSPLPKSI